MDLHAAKGQQGSKWAWARMATLLLFLLTGVLVLASLMTLKSQHSAAGFSGQRIELRSRPVFPDFSPHQI
jgi:hypothetical protein